VAGACATDPTDPTGDAAPASQPAGSATEWVPCRPGLECATVRVPVDHDRPDGPTLELALVRVPATDPARRIGSLFVNPGGPGGSGVEMVESGFRFDPETMAHFDLVGFDPRGVGRSGALACQVDLARERLPDPDPNDDAEAAALDAHARAIADRCAATDGELLDHLHTGAVVRDLDRLRVAVGDERLHFYGFSYGSLIALRYLEAFPERAGHVVLDGVVDPTSTLTELLGQQADGFEELFAGPMADDCAAAADDCPPGGLVAAYDTVRSDLEGDPDAVIGPAELATATIMATYDVELWPVLRRALTAATQGDLAPLATLNALYHRAASFVAYAAVSCTDTPVPRGPEAWDAFAAELAQRSPRFGAATANELRVCAHWPVHTDQAPGPVRAAGAGPVLVLGTTGDVATPVANAVAVAAQLEDGHLVVHEGTGHTAYGANRCVIDLVGAYLVEGRVPVAAQPEPGVEDAVRC
jgi:pimeloyl-ACP methyl ester carboxylesterase